MIFRHNLRQILCAPLHLLASALACWLCWLVFRGAILTLAGIFDPWVHYPLLAQAPPFADAFAWLALAAATWEAWCLWSRGFTDLSGFLGQLFPHRPLGAGAGSGRLLLAETSRERAIILNLALCGPMQAFGAWQRLRNLIPSHSEARERFERWRRFAEERGGWHSEALYSEDREALRWLILAGILDHSPTKARVTARNRASQ